MASIFLSIGSNIEPALHFQQCAKTLKKKFNNPVWSPVYRSAAVGMDANDFLNAVVSATTDQSIESTIELLKNIELKHGRVRNANKFTSRTLDVDLLLYDDIVLNAANITLHRTEITTAAYVLKPLADLVPNKVHPVFNKTYKTLLDDLEHAQPESKTSLSLVKLNLEH